MTTDASVDPITVTTVVPCSPGTAFEIFTAAIDRWWPRHRTAGGERVAAMAMEPGEGGRLLERWSDGSEHRTATVVGWDPGALLLLAWEPEASTAPATEVAVTFTAEGRTATRVRIEHRGWSAIADAADLQTTYLPGPGGFWNDVVRSLGDEALDPALHRFFAVRTNNAAWGSFAAEPFDPASALAHVHASAFHWEPIGAPENQARAAWMCARAYVLAGWIEPARYFADRCLRLTQDAGLVDFDLGYAYEAQARVAALAGDRAGARQWRSKAAEVPIADADDREIFDGDLVAGPWFGLDGGSDATPA